MEIPAFVDPVAYLDVVLIGLCGFVAELYSYFSEVRIADFVEKVN